MPSRNNVQNTHVATDLQALHAAIIDVVSIMNEPRRDTVLIEEAGIALDRALFPLLVGIDRWGPIGIVELAERGGRDYTTVSRQVSKLETLDLVERLSDPADGRVRQAAITPRGKAMIARLDAARERLGRPIFSTWEPGEVAELTRLLRKFVISVQPPPSQTS